MPELTITLPVYNAMPFLPEAVASVLGQTFGDFVFLIIDDGSTDESPRYLESLKDPRVRVVRQANRGLGATLNRLIELSETPIVARMDADDVIAPQRLQLQMDFLRGHPEVAMVGTQFHFIVNGRSVRGGFNPLEHGEIMRQMLQGRPCMCHASSVLRRQSALRIGGYRIAGAGEDLDFCLRMGEAACLANLAEDVYGYRFHRGNLNFTQSRQVRMGYAYALACAEARRQGRPEMDWESFRVGDERLPWTQRAVGQIDYWAENHYRKAIMAQGSESQVEAAAHYVVAAALRPRAVARRLVNIGRRLCSKPQA